MDVGFTKRISSDVDGERKESKDLMFLWLTFSNFPNCSQMSGGGKPKPEKHMEEGEAEGELNEGALHMLSDFQFIQPFSR